VDAAIYTSRIGSGNPSTPGILFTGDNNFDFGMGNSSVEDWIIGGGTYPDLFNPYNTTNLRTSYSSIQSILRQNKVNPISITDLSGCTNLNNCQLNPSVATEEAYISNGDLTITAFNFPGGGDKRVVFLIDGNLQINTSITGIPQGSSVVFIARGNITVAPTVGKLISSGPTCNSSADLEGFFSADGDFTIESNSSCQTTPDRMLIIEGVVVANGALGGGEVDNERDLCRVNNLSLPTYVIRERPDMLINFPDAIRPYTYLWQEVAP
jgi:hypothetical protein